MSPMNAHELLDELNAVEPNDLTELAARVIGRGHRVRARRRVGVGVLAATAMVALAVTAQLVPALRGSTAVPPAASPTLSSAPSATPTVSPSRIVSNPVPSPGGDTPISGRIGTVGITLPHQGAKASGQDQSDWTIADWFYRSCFSEPEPAQLAGLRASKIIQQLAPEAARTEGALVFADEAQAAGFVTALSTGTQRTCDKAPNGTGLRVRVSTTLDRPGGSYAQSVAVGVWHEAKAASSWSPTPGGSALMLARTRSVVVFVAAGGEFTGDPFAANDPWIQRELAAPLLALYPQACALAGTC